MDESGDKTLVRRVLMVVTVPLVALVTWMLLNTFSNVWEDAHFETMAAEALKAEQNQVEASQQTEEPAQELSDEEKFLTEQVAKVAEQNREAWMTLPSRTVEAGQEGVAELDLTFGSGTVAVTVNDATLYQSFDEFVDGEGVDAEALFEALPDNEDGKPKTRADYEGKRIVAVDASVRNIDATAKYTESDTQFRLSFKLFEGHQVQYAGESLNTVENLTVDLPQGESTNMRLYYSLDDEVDPSRLDISITAGSDATQISELVLFNLGL